MTTFILSVCSIVAIILAWLLRRRLTIYIPRKNTTTPVLLIAAIIVLAIIALLPDIGVVCSTMKLLALHFKIVFTLVIAATTAWSVACIGCSKQPQPARPIHWSAPESGYQETTLPPNNKEGP
jgi:hypothetical protein